MAASRNNEGARMGFHQGEVLWRLASDYYNTLMLTLIEAAQNAIDAEATIVLIAIDQQKSLVTIADNGTGIDTDKFTQALMSVGKGIKSKEKMGRFGLGLISPLNKCRAFQVTSHPAGTRTVNQWIFVGEQIRTQHSEVVIPYSKQAKMPDILEPFKTRARRLGATWNTMVQLDAVTRDRTVRAINLDELTTQIRAKLSRGMLTAGTTIHILLNSEAGEVSHREVDALQFSGEQLPLVEIDRYPECGAVAFELYRAPKTRNGRRGQVVVMQTGDNYQITWREFWAQAMGARLLGDFRESFDVLNSGYFEGVIYIEKVELDPTRSKFILNDAVEASYYAIDDWYQKYGKEHYETERESRRDERYQRLGQESLDRLLAKLNADPTLSLVLDELLGNQPTPEPRVRKQADDSAQAAKRKRTVIEPTVKPPRDAADRLPKKESVKLRFAFEQRPAWDNLWDYDADTATIVFNTLHPIWVMLDETDGKRTSRHDKQIIHLQTWLGLEVVIMLSEHDDIAGFESARHFIDRRIRPYAMTVIDTSK